MLLPLLVSFALADKNTAIFVNDPQYTQAPFAGLERLYVDPATTVGQVKPLATAPKAEHTKDAPGAHTVVFTNPMSAFGEVALNGTKIGTVGPFATVHLDGFAPGWYQLDVTMTSGFSRHFAVEVK